MRSFTAVTLLGVALFLEMLTGSQFGFPPALPLGVLFYFCTLAALPFALAGAILAGFILDALCCRAEALLLLYYPLALLGGCLIRWRLSDGGRWTALPAGAVIHLILNAGILRATGVTDSWELPLLFCTTAGAAETWLIVILLDQFAALLKIDRYAAAPGRQLNALPRKRRAPGTARRRASR